MGLKLLAAAAAVAAAALAGVPPADRPAAYLAGRQQPDGGFAEQGSRSSPALTAWAILGLDSASHLSGPARAAAAGYLAGEPPAQPTELALRILALRSLDQPVSGLVERLVKLRRSDGRVGLLVNTTIWAVLALRSARMPSGAKTVSYLLRQQSRSGGWSWAPGGAPDSNDTAAAIQALRSTGVSGRPIARGLAYLRGLEDRDGGFPLARGRPSDSQSTAWAVQAFAAAGRKPPGGAFRFLARMLRPDGSYRYSTRYVTTPVWVTAQVLPALAGKAFPLRRPAVSIPRVRTGARSRAAG